jgi:signal transduction histidine kinase
MLLFLARAEAEARLPNLETLDLAAWLPEHLRTWAEHARHADLQIVGETASPLWVKAQPPLLGQLVDNLLDNACKYSVAGTPVCLRLGKEADAVTLTIEDQGIGIASADVPHIFEPFFRSSAARHRGLEGVGLGLAVAQRIAMAFGGKLEVTIASGQGTAITLWLPALGEEAVQANGLVSSIGPYAHSG